MKRRKRPETFLKDLATSFTGSLLLTIPFFYFLYLSMGNWPLYLTIIHIAFAYGWPLFAIYAYCSGRTYPERWIIGFSYLLIPVILMSPSDDVARWMNFRMNGQYITLAIYASLFLGFILWLFLVIRNKKVLNRKN